MLKTVHCTRCETTYERDVKSGTIRRADRATCPRCRCEGWSILPRHEVERLVTDNQPLAQWCINRCTTMLTVLRREQLRDDLRSAANFALFMAACRYNPAFIAPSTGKPVLFSTFATFSINRTVLKAIADADGREHTYSDAETLIHAPSRHADGRDAVDARDEYERLMRVAGLTANERYAIHNRTMDSDCTLTEVADVLGLTRERVRQIEKTALGKMKRACGEAC